MGRVTYIGSSIGSFDTSKKDQMKYLSRLMAKDNVSHELNLSPSKYSMDLIKILTDRKLIRDELDQIKLDWYNFDKKINEFY